MSLPSFLSAPLLELDITATDDIIEKMWHKLAIKRINGLTALYDCTNGALIHDSDKRQHLDVLIAETIAFCKRCIS